VQAIVCREPVFPDGWDVRVLLHDRLWLALAPGCEPALRDALSLYAPLAMSRLVRPDGSFVLVHMAQSLDGMVSTTGGSSKWIGNDENLKHAHRVRALVDGVMVGGNTANLDSPSLNVRHVPGSDPVRIILSDSFTAIADLPRIEGMRTILLRTSDRNDIPAARDDIEVIRCGAGRNGVDTEELLASLRAAGVYSILVEGGPATFRTFFEAGAVDWLQLHVAPIIFGSGRSLLNLPVIDVVDDAVTLDHPFYTEMGDAIMVTAGL
jgi:riboflavin-specific deaminase-like protein